MGTSSLNGILSDRPGMDFLEEVFPLHSLTPRYSIISGKAALKKGASVGLALLHFGAAPPLHRLDDELSLMDLEGRSIFLSSSSLFCGLSLLKLFLCLDLCTILSN